jgi:hypothetical protein
MIVGIVRTVSGYKIPRLDRSGWCVGHTNYATWACVLCALALSDLMLAFVPIASAGAPLFTWSGDAAAVSGWSTAKNWEGEMVPAAPGLIALNFPRIPACTGACYKSKNDLSGLSVESISIDNGDEYEVSGDEITLGGGGIIALPAAGASGPAGDVFRLPIHLGAEQTWSVSQRSGEPTGENGMAVTGGVTGAGDALTIDMSDGPVLYLESGIEVGALAIHGTDAGEAGSLNGLVELGGVGLNSSDERSVSLSHILLVGSGATGPLSTDGAQLAVGGEYPAEGIEASSATLDAASEVAFLVTGAGPTAGADYSQLLSTGAVALNGAKLFVHVAPPNETSSCPSLPVGQTYTLVHTTGALTGSFGNAPEGSEISVGYANSCGAQPARYLRIAYHESGAGHTVTATVVEPSEPAQPTSESTSTSPGAIEPLPVNLQIEKEFHEHPPWTKAPGSAPGGVSLPGGAKIAIERARTARVKLGCTASKDCTGKLILTVKTTSKTKSGKKRLRTLIIGTAKFSVSAGKRATFEIALNALGRGLLGKDHKRFIAHVAILDAVPGLAK